VALTKVLLAAAFVVQRLASDYSTPELHAVSGTAAPEL
jgi:hypothetical protein